MISAPVTQSFTVYQHKLIKELKSQIETLTGQLAESDALQSKEKSKLGLLRRKYRSHWKP